METSGQRPPKNMKIVAFPLSRKLIEWKPAGSTFGARNTSVEVGEGFPLSRKLIEWKP